MKKNIFLKDFYNQTIILDNNLGIILGDANSGKTNILNLLNYGFTGTKKHISVNDKIVSLGEYNVIYVSDELLLSEDLKLAKNSDIKRYLLSYLNQQLLVNKSYNNLEILFENFKQKLSEIINSNLINKIVLEDLQLSTNILDLNLEKYLEKLVLINLKKDNIEEIDLDNFSKSKLRKLWYVLLRNIKILDFKKTNVILIDCPELYGGPLEWKWWGEIINNLILENNICILSTMNPFFLKYIDWEFDNLNFLFNNKIKHFSSMKLINDYIILSSFVENDAAINLSLYKNDIKKVILKEDIIKENKHLKSLFPNVLENYLINKTLKVTNKENFKNTVFEILLRYKIEEDLQNIEFDEKNKKIFKINDWF